VYLSSTDPQGYHCYLPLVRRPLGRQDFWLWLHRVAVGQVLDASSFFPWPLQEWVEGILLRHYLPPQDDLGVVTGESWLVELCHTARRGGKIAEDVIRLADGGRKFPGRLWQKIEALRAVDQGLRRIGAGFPELAAFVEFFFQEQRAKQTSEVIPLAQRLQDSYARLRRQGEVALECLAKLKIIRGLSQGGEISQNMAQAVQDIIASNEALRPESEELSCR